MAHWGVVLMTVTWWNGGVAMYGNPSTDTWEGWFNDKEVETCARAAAEHNAELDRFWMPKRMHFACMREAAALAPPKSPPSATGEVA